jgi:hypothetical protein
LISGATATAAAGGSDERLVIAYAKATATTIENNATATAESIVFDVEATRQLK